MANNDKISKMYNALVKSGYNMASEEVFRQRMNDPNKRRAAYDALKKSGYNMRPYNEFEANIGYGEAETAPVQTTIPAPQQQAQPSATAATATAPASDTSLRSHTEPARVADGKGDSNMPQPQVQPQRGLLGQTLDAGLKAVSDASLRSHTEQPPASASAQPAWQPTEQETTRMLYPLHMMMKEFNQRSKSRVEQTRRMTEHYTPEGRKRLADAKSQAQLMGTVTKVTGLTPNVSTTSADDQQDATDGADAPKPLLSGQSPVPYGVVMENGERKTQWLLPDGRLTTDIMEADQAEYGARRVRLMNQFIDRMRANGLDPSKKEDVQRQAQLDYEAPIRNAVALAVQADDERGKTEQEDYMSNPMNMIGGNYAYMGHKAARKSAGIGDLTAIAENAYNSLPTYYRNELIANYTKYFQSHPEDLKGKSIAQAAQDAAKSVVYGQVHETYVGRNAPKSKTEFFIRKMTELNPASVMLSSTITPKGQAYAELDAMDRYGAEHKGLSIMGTVAGMAIDPLVIGSGFTAGAAKGMLVGGMKRAMAKGMANRLAERMALSRPVTMRILGQAGEHMLHGALSFAGYEMGKDAERQMYQGGYVNQETGEIEDYNYMSILNSGVHGLVMGAATGWLTPTFGNVGDYIVSKIGKGTAATAGKAGVRTAEMITSKVLEGTIFASPDIYRFQTMEDAEFDKMYARQFGYDHVTDEKERAEARKNARSSLSWDAWYDSEAMMAGFGASHMVKSAPSYIRSLRAIQPKVDASGREIPLTRDERIHNMKSFMERLNERLSVVQGAVPVTDSNGRPNGLFRDMRFTNDEREELRRAGYGELADLFTRSEKPTEAATEANPEDGADDFPRAEAEELGRNPEFDGYEAMERLMQDKNVSQATRAKAYFKPTGRMLPMGTITGYTRQQNEDGTVIVNSVTANGEVVTSRMFANKSKAQGEIDNINRQAELNTIDIGERYAEEAISLVVLDEVKDIVATRHRLPAEAVENIYMKHFKGEKLSEAEMEIVKDVDSFTAEVAEKYQALTPAAMRENIEQEYGVNVDKALRKPGSDRSKVENEAVKEYATLLFQKAQRQRKANAIFNEEYAEMRAEEKESRRRAWRMQMEGKLLGYDPELQAEADRMYEESHRVYDRFEQGDPTAQAEIDAIALRMQEAYELCEDAFGTEAEYWMFHVNENPWSLINDPTLTSDQQEAVLYYINSKAALDGVMDASHESSQRKREQLEHEVDRRTHKESGVIIPATMKVDDRQVYVVKGDVAMFPDGSGVDAVKSSESIVIMDESGEYKFISPDQIYKVGESIDPQEELQTAYAKIDAEQEAVFGVDVPSEPEAPAEPASAPEAEAAQRPVTDVKEYDRGYEEGLEAASKTSDKFFDYLINLYSTQKRDADYYTGLADAFKYERQRRQMEAKAQPTEPASAPTEAEVPRQPIKDVKEYDDGYSNGVKKARGLSDAQLSEGIAKLRSRAETLTDFGRGRLEAYEFEQQRRKLAAQPAPDPNVGLDGPSHAQDVGAPVLETDKTVPNIGENAEIISPAVDELKVSTENRESGGESGSETGVSVGNEQQSGDDSDASLRSRTEQPRMEEEALTPLQRIPRNEKGEPMFELAESAEVGWDALVEFSKGDATKAKKVADIMVETKRKEYEKAQKLKPKGKTPSEILKSEEENEAQLAQAENEYNLWQRMARVEQSRQDAIRSQQEAEARRLAAERAEAEKAEREAREEAARLEREALEGIPEWHMDTPENARKRGARRFSGQMFQRQEPVQGVIGNEVEVKFSQKDLPKGRVAVIEASQLQPSHVQGQRKPMFFIDEAQPKNRAEVVSVYAAKDMAEGIRPQEITGSATAYTGAPTINTRGEVIQGNNRSDALRFLWGNNLPTQQQTYKQYLLDNAEQFGIDPEAVNAMQHPVLVNMLDVDDAEAIRLGQMTAQDTESGGIERIKPKNVAQKLGDDMRTFANRLLRSDDDDASFGQLVDSNGTDVLKWMNQTGAISNTQYQSAFDSKGNLTAEAKNDLQKVLYQAVFKGGSQQLEEMFDKLPAKAQRAILSTAFRDMDSPFAGKMLPEIQSSIMAYNLLMNDPAFAVAKNMEQVLKAISAFKSAIALDDRFEQYMPADNFSNFALQLAGMYKASDMSQTTIASYFNQMYDLAQGKKAATLFEEADTTEYPLAEVIKKVLNIDYQPAKNGNNNVANGGADVALRNQTSPEGEPRGSEPPASREQTKAGTEPSERGAGAADDSRGSGIEQRGRESQEATQQERLSKEEATDIIAKMEMSAVTDPKISLSPESWHNSFGLSNSIDTPLGKVKMGEGQYQKLVDKKRSAEFGMVVQTLQDPDVVFIEPSEAKEGQTTERGFSYVFVKTFIRDGKKFKYYTSVSVLKDGMEVSVSSHIASKTAILKKLQGMERAYTKETLLPNSSEWHLAEHPSDVPDLLPTQGKSEISDRKVTNSASDKQGNGAESSEQSSGRWYGTESEMPATPGLDSRRRRTLFEGCVEAFSKGAHERARYGMSHAFGEDVDVSKAELGYEEFVERYGEEVTDAAFKATEAYLPAVFKHLQSRMEKALEERRAQAASEDSASLRSRTERTVQAAVEAASAEVDISPTPAQVEAGNYKKGHVIIGEFDITIENPAGSVRKGVDADGKAWSTTMANAYGYIKGTESKDGDPLDVFLHEDMDSWNGRKVYVVDQTNTDGTFDEHKVMLGFNDKDEAMSAYLANYDKTWADTHPGIRISETNIEDFNKWVRSSRRKTKPFADYSTVSKVTEQPTQSSVITGKGYDQIASHPTYDIERRRDSEGAEYYAIRLKKGFKDREAWKAIAEKYDGIYSASEGRGVFLFYNGRDSLDAFLREVGADERDSAEENPRFEIDNAKGNRTASAEVCEVAKGMLEAAGIDVIEVGEAEAQKMLGNKKTPFTDQPNRANEKLTSGSVLLSISGNSSSNRAASKEAATKLANKTQSAKRKIGKFKNGDFEVNTKSLSSTLSDLGKMLSMDTRGGSRYTILQTDGGHIVAIRLSDHAANGNNFGQDNAESNLSIVIERRRFEATDSDIEFTEASIPLATFEARPDEVVKAIVSGVEDVLSDKAFSLTADLGTIEARGGIRDSISNKDAEYLEAVGRGDMETAERLVTEAAAEAGYLPENDYQGTSAYNGAAPSNGYGWTKKERREHWKEGDFEGDWTLGDDIDFMEDSQLNFLLNHPNGYSSASQMQRESIIAIRDAIKKGNRRIKVYRSVPDYVEENSLRNGDWVTPSLSYAKDNAAIHGWGTKYRIIEQEVDFDELWWDGNDVNEWGYDSDSNLGYKNTRNNRKLLDAVTYDDNGEVIPLSQRFDQEKSDVRYLKNGKGVVYGWTEGGKVYLNRDAMNPETPLHEYTHLWDDMVRRENPELWERGKELLKQTQVWQEVLDDPNYADIRNDEDAVASEVHSRLTGRRGAECIEEMMKEAATEPDMVEKAKRFSLIHQMKRWLSDMFRGLKMTLSKWSKRDLRNLTEEDFVNMTLRDLAEGVNPKSGEKDLVAIHNISEENLRKALDLGGFPMPSIAITKAGIGHTGYGGISLVFGKESVNPADRHNKVYSGDAWTPTFPETGYKLNSSKTGEIYDRANKAGRLPLFKAVDFHPDNYERRIDSRKDVSLVDAFKEDYGAKQLFLSEKGNAVREYEKREVEKYSADDINLYEKVLEVIGEERLRSEDSDSLYSELKRLIGEHSGKDMDSMKPFVAKALASNTRRKALDYADNGNFKTETDLEATREKIDDRIAPREFHAWLEQMFSGVVEKTGIRNERDMFTPSGESRRWEVLYDAVTLDNVVKAMRRQADKGGKGFFGGSIFGAAHRELKDMEEIRREAADRIRSVYDEEIETTKKRLEERLDEITPPSAGGSFSAAMDFVENVRDAVVKSHTPEGIYNYLSDIYPDMTIGVAKGISDIVGEIQKMSTRYLEAKPHRAVKLEEVRLAVVPEGTPDEIVRSLESRGIAVRTYERGNEHQRNAIVSRETSERELRFHAAMSRGRGDFDAIRERAVSERGIVLPGLNEAEVRVVEVPRHDFAGDRPITQARKWAKEHLVGEHILIDSDGSEVPYNISGRVLGKYLSQSAIDKSETLGAHLAVLKKLPEVISASIEAEIHPDYNKDESGERKPENGFNDEKLIHRFYGAVNIGGKIHRVKTTVEESRDSKLETVPHSFEVTEIELLPEDNSSIKMEPTVSPKKAGIPHRTAKLLKGVEKSYDPGKKLLDESEIAKYAEMDEDVEAARGSEPSVDYSAENANFASRYETEDGKTIRYSSERGEGYGGLFDFDFSGDEAISRNDGGGKTSGSNAVGSRSGFDDVQRERSATLAATHGGRLNRKAGEYCNVERVFTESGSFRFTSGEKIESADDVAFIFSALEDAAVEHTFAVYVKDGVPTVVELGMGSFNASIANSGPAYLAYTRIKPDEVYFVHNHPSGNLRCSVPDVKMLKQFQEMCDVPVHGVIINLKTGKYGTFDTESNMGVGNKRIPEKEYPLTLHKLDKQIFAPDYDPMAQPLVRGSQDVASFVNSHRMGDRAKMSFLVISQAGGIVGNIHMPYKQVSPANVEKMAQYISERVIQFGGMSAIVYGDFTGENNRKSIRDLRERMNQLGGVRLLDVMRIEGKFTFSANDEGMFYEPGSEYRLRDGEADGESASLRSRTEQPRSRSIAEAEMERMNDEFNAELARYKNGEMSHNEVIHLGVPQGVMRMFLPELPIVMRQRVIKKGTIKKHDVNLEAITDMPLHLSSPIFIFQRSEDTIGVLTDMKDQSGKNVCVAIEMRRQMQNGKEFLEVNDIRSFHGREFKNIVDPIVNNATLKWVDKEKGLAYLSSASQPVQQEIDMQVLEDAAKIVKDFENPTIVEGKSLEQRFRDEEADGESASLRSRTERRRVEAEMEERVKELSERLNTPVRILRSMKEIMSYARNLREKISKGITRILGNRATEIAILIPNNTDVADVENTFLHECVGHDGLRLLFPTEKLLNNALDELYDVSTDAIKADIDARAGRMYEAEVDRIFREKQAAHGSVADANANYYSDMAEAHAEANAKREQMKRDATEEYGANLSGKIGEKGFEEMSADELKFWGKLKGLLQQAYENLLRGLKIPKMRKWTDKQWSYICHKAYKMKKSGGRVSVIDEAEDISMRRRVGYDTDGMGTWEEKAQALTDAKRPIQEETYSAPKDSRMSHQEDAALDSRSESDDAKVRKICESLHILKNKVPDNGFGKSEIVYQIASAFGVKDASSSKSNYEIVTVAGQGRTTFRISNHSAEVDNFGRDSNNVGIVVKTSGHRFSQKTNVDYVEFVYYGDKVDGNGSLQRMIVDGLRHYIETGDFERMPEPDKLNTSGAYRRAVEGIGEEEVKYRDGADYVERDPVMARAMYEKQLQTSMYQFTEAMQDSMRGLMEFYKAVESQGAKRDIEEVASFENAYIAENLMSSKSHAEMEEYEHRIMRPLLDIAARLSVNQRGRQRLMDYMMAKHGLERNEYMRNEAVANGEESERDFAGLCGLTGEQDWQDAETAARQIVDEYEREHPTDITNLWDAVNKATKFSLKKVYDCGMLSKEQYEKIRDMYDFYIPLQGFDEKTSDDVYGYLTSKDGAFSSPIKKAKGRNSKADDPLATIAYMAQNSILQGNRNVMKQKFLMYVHNHPSDLASVNRLWLAHDETSDTWKPVFADINENMTGDEINKTVTDFEQRMESLSYSEPDKYKRGRDAIGIPYRLIDGNIREHQVLVKRNGESYVITINGNPRAAQAVNGLTNPDNDLNGAIGKIFNLARTVNRHLSLVYTTRSPDFVTSNFIRDLIYSNTMVHIKEGQGYAMAFHKNHLMVNPMRMVKLMHLYDSDKLNMHNPTHRMFYEFMHFGGETGYTMLRDLDKEKKLVAKIMKEARRGKIHPMSILSLIGHKLDHVNRGVENSARFAAFITSRQSGRDVQRSVYDAKEISVNFNKKGAGSKFMDANGQTMVGKSAGFISGVGNSFYVFWNAAVQGVANSGKPFKKHPKKAIMTTTALLLLGYIMAALMDDDDDEGMNGYYNIPKYTRRSNLMFRAGDQWLTIPLPVEYRALYGLGELAYGVTSGREEYSDGELAKETAAQLSQILPLDFMEGGGGLHAFVPSAFKPLVETATNRSWTGLPIYKDTPFNKDMPEWTKAYPRTNTQLVDLSKWANEASGGNDYKAGWANFNPAKLEYLLNGYFGGHSTVVNKMVKTGEMMLGDREYDPSNVLLVNRLVKMGDERTADRKINSDFFTYLEEYKRTHFLLRKYEEEADRGSDKYSIFLDALRHSRDGARHDVMDEYISDYNWLNKAIKDPDITEEEREVYETDMQKLKREVVSLMKVAHDSTKVNRLREQFAEESTAQ